MGEQIKHASLSPQNFAEFRQRLMTETEELVRWSQSILRQEPIEDYTPTVGLELETWLVDRKFHPKADNNAYLHYLDDPKVVAELSRFNAELNCDPVLLNGDVLHQIHREVSQVWNRSQQAARQMNLHHLMVGSLPTLHDGMLCMETMSEYERYRWLNHRILELRDGKPIHIDIAGTDHLQVMIDNIMMEAACTSLQVHLCTSHHTAHLYMNSGIALSAAMAALCANSPYVFGNDLWAETRIPLFEQSLSTPGFMDEHGFNVQRVSFGSGFADPGLAGMFAENLERYPVLLPILYETPTEEMRHVRFHNGNIWRWNRPIVGFESDGKRHIRIEHRVPAAGPTLIDVVANVAFFLGAATGLVNRYGDIADHLDFHQVRQDFYEAAKEGLSAQVSWVDGKRHVLQELIRSQILPLCREGLVKWGVNSTDNSLFLKDILEKRVRTGQTGAVWQRQFIAKHGTDFDRLTAAYFQNQESGRPVHEWVV